MSEKDDKEETPKSKYEPQPVFESDLSRKQRARMARHSQPTKRERNRDYQLLPKGSLATD